MSEPAPAGAIPFFRVSAFASHALEGNPAGVCVTERPLPDALMAAIATENALSETAFLVRLDAPAFDAAPDDATLATHATREATRATYSIRWFAPGGEVDLCGHATLAAAHVLATAIAPGARRFRFESPRAGALDAELEGDRWWLSFPALPVSPGERPEGLDRAVGEVSEVWDARFLLAVLPSERAVRELAPDMAWVAALPRLGLVVTAKSESTGVDFVSRYFVPQVGITEDPVSGGTHCVLAPFWAARLGKEELRAEQVSARGGELACRVGCDRVRIGGRAVTYASGTIDASTVRLP